MSAIEHSGGYGSIDGHERAGGSVDHTTNFKPVARASGFPGLRLDLNVDPDGYVGIETGAGLARRAEIYLKRSY